jgi:hypothetical protein
VEVNRALLAAVLVAVTACAGGESGQTASTTAPRATRSAEPSSDLERAHDFTLRTFDGDTFTLSDHFGELPVVLNFWAPW